MSRYLLKCSQKFQTEEPHLSGGILTENLGGYGRSFVGDDTGGGGGGCWDGEVDELVGSKDVSRGNTSPRGADIHGLRQFDELRPRGIRTAYEDGYLKPYTR